MLPIINLYWGIVKTFLKLDGSSESLIEAKKEKPPENVQSSSSIRECNSGQEAINPVQDFWCIALDFNLVTIWWPDVSWDMVSDLVEDKNLEMGSCTSSCEGLWTGNSDIVCWGSVGVEEEETVGVVMRSCEVLLVILKFCELFSVLSSITCGLPSWTAVGNWEVWWSWVLKWWSWVLKSCN